MAIVESISLSRNALYLEVDSTIFFESWIYINRMIYQKSALNMPFDEYISMTNHQKLFSNIFHVFVYHKRTDQKIDIKIRRAIVNCHFHVFVFFNFHGTKSIEKYGGIIFMPYIYSRDSIYQLEVHIE